MTETSTLQWIKTNLAQLMPVHPIYTEDWLAGMVMRETGILIMRYASVFQVSEVHLKMKGDYSKRPTDSVQRYHGFGYMQIDVKSYPDFVNSGDWQDPHKTFLKAIEVLDEKRNYIVAHTSGLGNEILDRATTAAYNCGQGNVMGALRGKKDIDTYTFNHDYSSEVWRFRSIYHTLPV